MEQTSCYCAIWRCLRADSIRSRIRSLTYRACRLPIYHWLLRTECILGAGRTGADSSRIRETALGGFLIADCAARGFLAWVTHARLRDATVRSRVTGSCVYRQCRELWRVQCGDAFFCFAHVARCRGLEKERRSEVQSFNCLSRPQVWKSPTSHA